MKDTNADFAQRHKESLETFEKVSGAINKSFDASRVEANNRYDKLLEWHANGKKPTFGSSHHEDRAPTETKKEKVSEFDPDDEPETK